jgi:hypothetical protein
VIKLVSDDIHQGKSKGKLYYSYPMNFFKFFGSL